MKSLLSISQQKISHEFNTALTGILSNTAMLRNQILSSQQANVCINDIYHSSEGLLTFIHSLLNAAKQAMLTEILIKNGAPNIQKAVPVETARIAGLSVLLVEDEPIIQRVHSKMLQGLNCHVEIAGDGYQALEKLNNTQNYDVIFMDIGLPGINGIETVKRLRQQAVYKEIPVIGLTAYQIEDIKKDCEEAGFNQVMAKPVSLESLKSILLKLVEARIRCQVEQVKENEIKRKNHGGF